MALSPQQQYPNHVDLTDGNFIDGKYRDNNPTTTNNGTPLKQVHFNQQLAFENSVLNHAGMTYNGLADTPQNSQIFQALNASVATRTNLLNNSNFLSRAPAGAHPFPSSTPHDYPADYPIFDGVFAGSSGANQLKHDASGVHFTGGSIYFLAPNVDSIALTSDYTSSASAADGKPKTTGVSHSIIGDNYKVEVTSAVFAELSAIMSVKFEEGSLPSHHEIAVKKALEQLNTPIGGLIRSAHEITGDGRVLVADGRKVNKIDYPELYERIGDMYQQAGDSNTQLFRLPKFDKKEEFSKSKFDINFNRPTEADFLPSGANHVSAGEFGGRTYCAAAYDDSRIDIFDISDFETQPQKIGSISINNPTIFTVTIMDGEPSVAVYDDSKIKVFGVDSSLIDEESVAGIDHLASIEAGGGAFVLSTNKVRLSFYLISAKKINKVAEKFLSIRVDPVQVIPLKISEEVVAVGVRYGDRHGKNYIGVLTLKTSTLEVSSVNSHMYAEMGSWTGAISSYGFSFFDDGFSKRIYINWWHDVALVDGYVIIDVDSRGIVRDPVYLDGDESNLPEPGMILSKNRLVKIGDKLSYRNDSRKISSEITHIRVK